MAGSQNNLLVNFDDSLKYLNNQKLVRSFRGQWQYNNLGYAFVGHVIQCLSRISWGDFLERRILRPRGLARTGIHKGFPSDTNMARAYGALDDATAVPLDEVKIGDSTFYGAGGGIRT